MDSRFQSSFIPRKPVDTGSLRPSGDVNIILIASIIIFIVTAAVNGGVFVYKSTLEKTKAEKVELLESAKKSFGLDEIGALKQRARQLESIKKILSEHVSVSPLFSLIEDNTLRSVRFTSFSFSNKGGKPSITLSGEARGWNAVAYQSQVFSRINEFLSPVLSSFAPKDNGNISFNFTSDVTPKILFYTETLGVSRSGSSADIDGDE